MTAATPGDVQEICTNLLRCPCRVDDKQGRIARSAAG